MLHWFDWAATPIPTREKRAAAWMRLPVGVLPLPWGQSALPGSSLCRNYGATTKPPSQNEGRTATRGRTTRTLCTWLIQTQGPLPPSQGCLGASCSIRQLLHHNHQDNGIFNFWFVTQKPMECCKWVCPGKNVCEWRRKPSSSPWTGLEPLPSLCLT